VEVTAGALERLALYFGAERTRQGLLARIALGVESPRDPEITRALRADLESDIRPDGSVGGGALPTIWRVHELIDLGRGGGDRAVQAAMRWLMELQGKPGAFGEGCDKARHAQRACEHYVQGFFSPAPATVRLAPVTFPNGKVFRAEPAARYALSCLALRAALRIGSGDHPSVDRHVRSLAVLAGGWTNWNGFFAPDAIVAGMHALAHAGPGQRPIVAGLVALVAKHQDAAGGWPNADLFHTLEALIATGLPEARESVRRAAPALRERQRADGTFGGTAQQERALIGLRALLWGGARV
jgi:hypothetical protein